MRRDIICVGCLCKAQLRNQELFRAMHHVWQLCSRSGIQEGKLEEKKERNGITRSKIGSDSDVCHGKDFKREREKKGFTTNWDLQRINLKSSLRGEDQVILPTLKLRYTCIH